MDTQNWEECELQTEHFSASMHLNAISNGGTAANAMWAVNDVTFPWWPHSNGGYITVRASIGINDIDGMLWRIGYNVTLLGQMKWELKVPIN